MIFLMLVGLGVFAAILYVGLTHDQATKEPYPECLEFTKGSFVQHKSFILAPLLVLEDSEYGVLVRDSSGHTNWYGCWEMEMIN